MVYKNIGNVLQCMHLFLMNYLSMINNVISSKSTSKTLLPELMKRGVHCDLRLLHVGDLLWLAKERVVDATGRYVRWRQVFIVNLFNYFNLIEPLIKTN